MEDLDKASDLIGEIIYECEELYGFLFKPDKFKETLDKIGKLYDEFSQTGDMNLASQRFCAYTCSFLSGEEYKEHQELNGKCKDCSTRKSVEGEK